MTLIVKRAAVAAVKAVLILGLISCPAWAQPSLTGQADAESERDWITYTEFDTREDMLKAGLSAFKAENYEAALNNLLPLAIDGNVKAQAYISQMFRDGLGVPEDRCVATIWAEKAARQGDLFGAWMLSFAYSGGEGIRKNPEMAYRWMKYAAMQGDEKAEENVEFMSSGLSSEQIAAINEDMKTWEPSKQAIPEFFYIDKNDLLKDPYKDSWLYVFTDIKMGVSWCR